jgi:hypothetical protein
VIAAIPSLLVQSCFCAYFLARAQLSTISSAALPKLSINTQPKRRAYRYNTALKSLPLQTDLSELIDLSDEKQCASNNRSWLQRYPILIDFGIFLLSHSRMALLQ